MADKATEAKDAVVTKAEEAKQAVVEAKDKAVEKAEEVKNAVTK